MTAAHRSKAFNEAKRRIKPQLEALIRAGGGWCFDGNHPLPPGMPWDVSHIVPVHVMKAQGIPESQWHKNENLTSSCRTHNRSAGGRAGAQKTNATKRTNKGLLPW